MKTRVLIAGILLLPVLLITCKGNPFYPSNKTGRYLIGDIGPGGGRIFYDKEDNSDGWRYLEVAPGNAFPGNAFGGYISWATFYDNISTADPIGTGKNNTVLIINVSPVDNASTNAAKACAAYRGPNNKKDWFLPSKDELAALYNERERPGIGITSGSFWSSSQSAIDYAFFHDFSSGNVSYLRKDDPNTQYVRAIRSF